MSTLNNYTRRNFLKGIGGLSVAALALPGCVSGSRRFVGKAPKKRPNILFAIADDWSWPHASIAGDSVIRTPTFDRVAHEGVLFKNAFVTTPSCTPSRASILTGQWHWRLEEGVNLHSPLPAKFEVYPDILERAGYHVGFAHKGWGPGDYKAGGRKRNPAGQEYVNFGQFLKARPADKPFCFWFGGYDPHRPYKKLAGVNSGMRIQDVTVPSCLPDSEQVRADICDYYWEVQRFDSKVGQMLKVLEENGELDNTLVVISSDNGMPFPRCKANLYDLGTHMPLAVRWGEKVKGGRVVEDFVSLTDLAPTFLEAAGLRPIAAMTGRSFLDVLISDSSGWVNPKRDRVFTGMERHAGCRKNNVGYPMRAVRTNDFLYIRNFKPDRWPAGDPRAEFTYQGQPYGDVDASPTKSYMMAHRNDPKVRKLFELAFEKRPAEELYDLRKDPAQLHNVAGQAGYAEVKSELAAALMAELTATKDPRVLGKGDVLDKYPYYGRNRSKRILRKPNQTKR
ncbi:MAG TPA: heparan N-sulfatase [Phycisphaerales bacterium]|nr:heparan N-sulfatase [Phycisphaerales bacterium]